MILARTKSEWLKQHLKEQGGEMTIALRTIVVNWWLAGQVPSGLVGKPEHPEDYVPVQVGEWARRYGTIYIPGEMWEGLRPHSQEFNFYIEHVGRFRLEFDLPLGRLQGES